MSKFRYSGSTGKSITRDVAVAGLTAGSHVMVSVTMKGLKVTKEAEDLPYQCRCQDCNAKCKMSKPENAIYWAVS